MVCTHEILIDGVWHPATIHSAGRSLYASVHTLDRTVTGARKLIDAGTIRRLPENRYIAVRRGRVLDAQVESTDEGFRARLYLHGEFVAEAVDSCYQTAIRRAFFQSLPT